MLVAWLMSLDLGLKTESFELVPLGEGEFTLKSVATGETFHPGIGPMAEAQILYVKQQELLERSSALHQSGSSRPFVIWDVGLGAAANAIAALRALQDESCGQVELHSFDRTLDPLLFSVQHAKELRYPLGFEAAIADLMKQGQVELGGGRIRWVFHRGEFRDALNKGEFPAPDSILFDPYSFTQSPELWTLEAFQDLLKRTDPARPFLWSNYTRSTSVRVTLLLAGFYVGVGAGVGEKEETTVASNSRFMISQPLTLKWLERVKKSHHASPRRDSNLSLGPIGADDFQELEAAISRQI